MSVLSDYIIHHINSLVKEKFKKIAQIAQKIRRSAVKRSFQVLT